MSGGIYLIQGEDQLTEMQERPYDSEALLQELLERYPNLIGVEQPDSPTAREWLIVKRTGGVPTDDLGVERWSLNHLFLDQQAIPTLVEVQNESDPRLRREIIGHMLDYAANAVVYWPVESILDQFEINCRRQNRDPEQVFEDFLGSDADEEQFWQRVKTNLQAGKIRLIFVADRIPPEIQRVVEFLNKQMDPAEVLAVEIKQYISLQDGLKTLVSNVIGQTAEAQQKKSSTSRERRQWDEHSFLSEYKARYGEDEMHLVYEIYQWVVQSPDLQLQWGTGDTYGGFAAKLKHYGPMVELFFVGIDGTFQIASEIYAHLPPFNDEEKWHELRNHLSSVGLALPTSRHERRLPNFQLSTVPDEDSLETVLTTFDWVMQQIKEAHHY
ncbi:hypothetical protein PN462_14665 [Spirulina sp. CS-785/01]|uniref:hypothetical protein n=1 Tax=Spirulina sp. CS-785/01 TaxID=3021716 RepID=UPI00232E483B|nr:hypothetical protein [Spirulina sp. CS-785/01]MDB9314352.1 hypothetical protein [Spirulina sp. CS-785/01]